MKITKLFYILLMVTAMIACGKSEDSVTLPDALVTFKADITLSFDSLDTEIDNVVAGLIQSGIDTSTVRIYLRDLVENTTFETNFGYITGEGVLQIIEPDLFKDYEGSDISAQTSLIEAFTSKGPVLSDRFLTVEGFYAAVDLHPIVSNNQVLGAISCLFRTEILLGRAAAPLLEGQTFELWVMEKEGTMIYNQDDYEIGLNIFTDPVYAPFPELITAAHKMADEDSGETVYSFYQTGTSTVVTKKTYWNTLTVHGTEWKLVWVKPE